MLLTCLMFAFLLPLIHLPPQWSFRKSATETTVMKQIPDANTVTQEESGAQVVVQNEVPVKNSFFGNISSSDLLIGLYWIGVAIFSINFIVQLITLIYRSYSRPVIQDGRFRIVELSGEQAPCSFGNTIFINPEKYDWDTYSQIILHEKVHIQQGHSYDIIFAELALVFQWFNPFAWLYRKAVEDNLEFLTDNELLEHKEVDPGSYQLSLVKVSAPHFPVSLTTNYNQSVLKKRLIMMNAKKSSLNTTWKYLCIVPLFMAFVCFLNEPAAYGTPDMLITSHDKGLTYNQSFANEGVWFATIKNNKVLIRFEKDQEEKESSSSTFLLDEFKSLPREKEGDFELSREAGTILFNGKFNGNMGMGTYKFNPNKEYFSYLKKEGIDLNENQDAIMFFAIDMKKSYFTMLKKQGYQKFTKDNLIPLVALKVDEKFITDIKSNGFSDVSLEDLVTLKALGVDGEYVKDIKKSGYKDLTVSQLITFKSQGIDGDFIANSRKADQATRLKDISTQKKDKAAISEDKELKSDSELPSIDDLVAMKAMNIDPAYIKGFKQIGYAVSNEDLIGMKALNVTPDFVNKLQAAGFKNISSEEVIALKALGVTPEEIKEYKTIGYPNITVDELTSAKAVGVTPDYIAAMKKKGHNLSSVEKYVEIKALGLK
ncbi:Regulatory sensor-transducer, BlaR1/MecR1 family [Arcticibacter svalbardensis MN12-7]|uniref:Regulatory sensor-transducer, BlaR1/MecR1 family n=2 Tax=Arcticibacter TaxID=1288026 RepID=R9GW80_9SPHI|nr:Regulatory sensor-transducer, BlaR1/MecR1 family [Arcticibacter svalbardensis MN12-7]